jgi:tetrahydromethanopterin S-methyltransferase subunit G
MLEELSAGQEYELNEIKKRLEKIEKIENFVKILEKYIEDNKKAGK